MRVHAAYTQRLGPTELITYGQVDVADAASDDVVISTKAVALNPVDTYIRSGRFDTRVSFPLILGRDVVGVVEQAPADSGLRPGQLVWANTMGFDGRQGSFATAVVAHRNRVYPLPQQVDPLIAVSLVHPATTAALGFAAVPAGPGDDVFIAGAGGNVGNAAVTYAAKCGARVVANASPEDFARVKRAGAHVVVDYQLGAEDIVRHVPRGADVVWDCSGRMGYDDLATIAGVKGHIIVTAATAHPAPVPWVKLYTKDITVKGFVHSRATVEQMAHAAKSVNALLSDDALIPSHIHVERLSHARWAHEQMEAGQVKGRIVLTP